MRAISGGMGGGGVKRVELEDVVEEEWCEFVTVDLKMKCSQIFREAKFWHCKKGICIKTMPLLNQ